ncbi:MAG: tyrosine-type recombinase/integrase [Candidatus Microthrix sp.]|jgi:integrase/recombinase XerD|nr:tyrosine-type recombinase/integrase [Candidatus Microthrix sp.]HBX10522.1 integrase [Candidatus Microthrix parvicella]
MNMPSPTRVRVAGPLQPYAVGFRQELSRLGYSSSPAAGHLQLMEHLSCWLDDHNRGPEGLTAARVDEFLDHRRSQGRLHQQLSLGGLSPLLSYLREVGVVPPPALLASTGPFSQLMEEFVGYLRDERGLAENTVGNYRCVAELFLSTTRLCGSGEGRSTVSDLRAGDVIGFMVSEANSRSAGSLSNVATGLRAFLRFLHLQGFMATCLATAVPAATGWRDGGLLCRAVESAQVAQLLASCDRRTGSGRRDFAILTVLARLGLRAGEVAALGVDDIDWRAGELVVTGKGNRRDRLPLPVDVGQAIADYCARGRRHGDCRSLFLHARAPYVGVSGSAVREVVARACDRVGVPRIGAHRLRHAAATSMRRAGAPLFEIAQVLRHRHLPTTAHYARDDVAALAVVARGWLGGDA